MSSKRSLKKKHSSERQIRITKSTDNIALAEVTKKLRDPMGGEDDDDSSGIFAVYDEVPAGHWANGGEILHLSELLKRWAAMCWKRKREMKALFDGRTA